MIEQSKKLQGDKIGKSGYLNKNCWLVKSLNYAPYNRCQYCESEFRNCQFLHYQIISLIFIILFLTLSLFIGGNISIIVIISIFVLVIIYGYFFNKSTDNIIRANFAQKKAKEALKEFNERLEQIVDSQTKDIKAKNIHLEKLLKMRSEFLDTTSHQLRTPTSVIIGILEMLRDGDLDALPKDIKKQQLDGAYYKARKLEQIVSDLLRASELDSAPYTLKPGDFKEINLEEFLNHLIFSKAFQLKKQGVKVSLIKPLPLSKICGDERFLEEAIGNLLDNAIKYTPKINEKTKKPGEISVKVEKNDKYAMIKVSDNGIGIPKEESKKLFDKFVRANNAKEMYTDGTGLGLFVVREVVNGHGGKVNVESILGQGSTFTISLLLKPPLEKSSKEDKI